MHRPKNREPQTLAVITGVLVLATFWLVYETRHAATRQIGVQTWLALDERFDSKEMKQARKALAAQLDPYDPKKFDEMDETVLDFFEDVGVTYKNDDLDKELAMSSFSYEANLWWASAEEFVHDDRIRSGNDPTVYDGFENLAKAMRRYDPKVDSKAVKQFLEDEKSLSTD
jgi:uncharacterized protein YdaU (DUF1376 family)